MIQIRLLETGWVIIRPKTKTSAKKLQELKCVRRKKDFFITYWPHLLDIKQNFKNINWDKDLRKSYKRVITSLIKPNVEVDVSSLFNEGRKPYNYQLKGIKRLMAAPAILADDTGLGKTPQTIGAAVSLYSAGEIDRSIFIVPSGLKSQWYEEFFEFIDESKFNNLRDKVVVINGPKKERKKIYSSDWKFLIMNYALIHRDEDILKEFTESGEVGFVGLDEASYIRNPSAKRTKKIKKLFREVPYRVAITATPIENSLVDLYSIMQFVDNGVFMNKKYFESKYCIMSRNMMTLRTKEGQEYTRNIQKISGYKNLNEVKKKIDKYYIRRLPKDVGLELPDIIVNWLPMNLKGKQKKIYKSLRDKTKGMLGQPGVSLFFLLHDLRKACNSAELINPKIKQSCKIDRLKGLFETEFKGQQVVVFTGYKTQQKDIFKREFRKYNPTFFMGVESERDRKNRDQDLKKFKQGKSQVMFATSAGERGLNLQFAPLAVNFDLPWNPASLKQRIGRICRIGSKHDTVRLINLVAKDTVEEKLIMQKIYKKRQLFESIIGSDEYMEADPLTEYSPDEILKLI